MKPKFPVGSSKYPRGIPGGLFHPGRSLIVSGEQRRFRLVGGRDPPIGGWRPRWTSVGRQKRTREVHRRVHQLLDSCRAWRGSFGGPGRSSPWLAAGVQGVVADEVLCASPETVAHVLGRGSRLFGMLLKGC